MFHKTLFASASFCLGLQLWCLLEIAKCMQVGQPVQTNTKGNVDKGFDYNDEAFERFFGAPVSEQHLSFPSPVLGFGSVPESAVSTSKDHLRNTDPSHREQDTEELFQALHTGGLFQNQVESPRASQRYGLTSSSHPFILDEADICDLDDLDHFSDHVQASWSQSPSASPHFDDELIPDMQAEQSMQKEARSRKTKKGNVAFATAKCQKEARKFWRYRGHPKVKVAWYDYWRVTGHKVFMKIAVRAFRNGQKLHKVLEHYRLKNGRPVSWLNGLIDYPTALVEDRVDAKKDAELHQFISDWAAAARDLLATRRGGYLDFTEKINEVWQLKPLETSGEPEMGRERLRKTIASIQLINPQALRFLTILQRLRSLRRHRVLQTKRIRSYMRNSIRNSGQKASLESKIPLDTVIYRNHRCRPPTWLNGIIDHPSRLVEQRLTFRSSPEVHRLIKSWAHEARNELTKKRELRYMQKLVGSEYWTMKPKADRTVREPPERWRSSSTADDQQHESAREQMLTLRNNRRNIRSSDTEQPVPKVTLATKKREARKRAYFAKTRDYANRFEFWKTCKNKKMQQEWRSYDRTNAEKFWQIAVPAVRKGLDVQKALDTSRLNRTPSWLHGMIDHPTTLLENQIDREKEPCLYRRISEWAAEARDALTTEKGGNLSFTEKANGAWQLKPVENRPTNKSPDPYKWTAITQKKRAPQGRRPAASRQATFTENLATAEDS
ncbi:hypothetical protein FA10DRAFT_291436 [Acaromyces ingoldii]|uniref:Uncharacterized protein n=1 Tax=Acaromyces ingoldii TaxID=215250 RepID=A0A316YYK5_9BASI|nr:hypothetical protein FA10DRAFT_291436 [Acaromyces ingoldii]PWN94182.1 hypothetical protein FA10DRAFT_291436 [Acaromyces ingoldii]